MRREHLKYLACPACRSDIRLLAVHATSGERIENGSLGCSGCGVGYDIKAYIPRFVPGESYAASFGLQWGIHAKTQYDSHTGVGISETRFFRETRWPRRLAGETILEVGGGSGRFTEQAARTGAMVVSLDYSRAVEANYASNGQKPNVLIVQGDIFRMPFREASFDKLFCFGVLQHTPDVERAFRCLPSYLKRGGQIAVDVYRRPEGWKRFFTTKHWVRPLTRRLPPATLYWLVRSYVTAAWPVTRLLSRIPRVGKKLNWALLIADHRGVFPLPERLLKEWAILDTFDILSPAYDFPQRLETVQQWFRGAGLTHYEVQYGYNGIEGRGRKG